MENNTPENNNTFTSQSVSSTTSAPESQPAPVQKNSKDISKLYTPIAVVIAGIIIAAAIVFTRPQTANIQGNNAQTPPPVAADIKKVNIKNEPFIGDANAPVVIAYWSDYQCPFCKQFEQTTMAEVIKNYVDTHKVKIVFKDFQFLGPDSQAAALASRAVWENYPNQYFDWREAMFEKQDAENGGFGKKEDIIVLTKTIKGIDANKISSLMDTNKVAYQKTIDADKQEGIKFGVRGTPGFIVGKQLIPGVVGYSEFAELIDAELK